MNHQQHIRSYLIDNAKGIFIILVLLAHTPPYLTINNIPLSVKMVVHCIIMPGFFFYSGLLSKDVNKRVAKAYSNILLPYLFFTTLSATFHWFRNGNHDVQNFNVFIPQIGFTWYILTLFIMILMLPIFAKLKKSIGIAISLLLSCCAYKIFDENTYEFLSIGIAVSMLPMFLIGYYCPVQRFKNLGSRSLMLIGGVIGITILCLLTSQDLIYFRFRPHFYHTSIDDEIVKIVSFICTILIIGGLNTVLPKRKCFLSIIGQNSLMVYLLHEYIYSFSGHLYDINNDYVDILIALVLSCFVAYLLSRPIIMNTYNRMMITIKHILGNNT